LLVAFPIHLMLNLGLSAVVARMAIPFRDINNFIPYVNRLWLYLSPIIWPLTFLENLDPWARALVQINPMYHVIGMYRTALIGYPDYPFNVDNLMVALAWALGLAVVGVGTFVKYETRMVRYL
jgi:teichoic acid transport system permease protein